MYRSFDDLMLMQLMYAFLKEEDPATTSLVISLTMALLPVPGGPLT